MFKVLSVTSKALLSPSAQMSIEFGNPGSSFGWLLQHELPGFKKKVQKIHKSYAENWKRIVISGYTLFYQFFKKFN